ncbi:hypothetical protein QQP08_024132 [Theobroma cacao]|nr:hypothetical protein QQP08_024132 [Theobroma cacao]
MNPRSKPTNTPLPPPPPPPPPKLLFRRKTAIWSMRTGFFMIAVLKHVPTASKTLLEGEEGDG